MNESYYGPRLLLLVLIVGANAFFAGAEVALLSVRKSRLRQLAEQGNAGAAAALGLLARPERLLSVTQFGVTLASLGLGWAGEETLYQLLLSAFGETLAPVQGRLLHGLSLALAFLAIAYAHVVVGEVVPKNLGIERADRLASMVAPPLMVFARISAPFVVFLERSSALLSRALGVRGGANGGGHSAEELKWIVSSSRGSGQLPEAQEDMIHRALDLNRISVREIMVPRNEIVSVPIGATLDQVLAAMVDGHSRLPVYDGAPERIVGVLHFKDLLPIWQERRNARRAGRPARDFVLTGLMRKHLVVPETKPLAQMLEEFQQGRSHMAVVVDEFGTVAGLLTVEDVLEQIVGEIEDEYDEKAVRPHGAAAELELDGATKLLDLDAQYGIELPSGVGFETLAGFVLSRLGYIPREGQSVADRGRRFTVLAMDRNRIARVRIEKEPQA